MKVPTQNKRHNSVGWANVFFAHAERTRVQPAPKGQVAHPTNLCSYALFLLCSCALTLTTGCGPQEPPGIKKARAIAAENLELRKELDRRNEEIEKLKTQYGREIEEQQKLIAECLQEKDALKEKSRQNIRNQVKSVLDTVLEENKNLRESTGRLTAENAKLKAQIEELQKQPQ